MRQSVGQFPSCELGKHETPESEGHTRAAFQVEPALLQQSYSTPVTLQHRAIDDGLLLSVLWKGVFLQGKLSPDVADISGSGFCGEEGTRQSLMRTSGQLPTFMHDLLPTPQQTHHGHHAVVSACDAKPSPTASDPLVRTCRLMYALTTVRPRRCHQMLLE
jgi:hypothetical protein